MPAPLAGESDEELEELSVLKQLELKQTLAPGDQVWLVLDLGWVFQSRQGRHGQRPASRSRTEMLGEVRPLDRRACPRTRRLHKTVPAAWTSRNIYSSFDQ